MKYQEIISKMTREEKVAFCSGENYWRTKSFPLLNIPSILMTDGPHGLRKVIAPDKQGDIEISHEATCFPTASLTACSWDRELLYQLGQALAKEALQEQISIILGPGVNIQRNPLCGRNFEYFSEDPLLAAEMAVSWIKGVQDKGVGVSLKHFAGNNQETLRYTVDSLIDERALREIYLAAFENAVKDAKPTTVMSAYNKLNGAYCSDSAPLLRDILRKEWGFDGVIVTDWGGMGDRVKAFKAGLDLEMPGGASVYDADALTALESGGLTDQQLDESVDRLLALVFSAADKIQPDATYNREVHHQLARKIAASSAVLLKNDDQLLPIKSGQKIAIIGALAKFPRYQGNGSSFVNPTKVSNALDGFTELGVEVNYFPGYDIDAAFNRKLMEEAVNGAKESDLAIIFAGLTDNFESEGFDRNSLAMPESHNELIRRVAQAQPAVAVVLAGGSPVEMPWLPEVKAVLNMMLPGQAGGLAAVDLLTGRVNPGGKLAATYPIRYEDVPSAKFYKRGGLFAEYRESIYVGYRFYEKAKTPVAFPFGHGLSYTTFEYSDLELSSAELQPEEELVVKLAVRNTGEREGAEIVQLYVGSCTPDQFRPVKELRAFEKVLLAPGEKKAIEFKLNSRDFAIFDPQRSDWVVPTGEYRISVGSSSQDIRLQRQVAVFGSQVDLASSSIPAWYLQPNGECPPQDFSKIYGKPILPPKPLQKGEFTFASTLKEMSGNWVIRAVINTNIKKLRKEKGSPDPQDAHFRMVVEGLENTPIKNLAALSKGRLPVNTARGLVEIANGKVSKGLLILLRKS